MQIILSLWESVSRSGPLGLFLGNSQRDSNINLKKQITASGDYKQKIAVIPFTNLNKDEDGAFLVDGIVEDLITEFSMISEIEIVSSNLL